MGLLNTTDYQEAYRRTIAASTKRCRFMGARDVEGKATDDGSPAKDTTFIDLQLDEDAKTIDGDTIAAGAVISVTLNTTASANGDPRLETMNRISKERFRELIVALLGVPPNTKDVAVQLEKNGGIAAMKGRMIAVDFKPTGQGQNSANKFAALPKN